MKLLMTVVFILGIGISNPGLADSLPAGTAVAGCMSVKTWSFNCHNDSFVCWGGAETNKKQNIAAGTRAAVELICPEKTDSVNGLFMERGYDAGSQDKCVGIAFCVMR